MRLQFLAVIFFLSLFAVAKDAPRPILVSHNDIKGPLLDEAHTEDLTIFADGRVSYKEEGNDRKTGSFSIRLTPQKLHRLTMLIESKEIRSLPAEIPSQIRTIDYNWEKKMDLFRKGSKQTVAIRNSIPCSTRNVLLIPWLCWSLNACSRKFSVAPPNGPSQGEMRIGARSCFKRPAKRRRRFRKSAAAYTGLYDHQRIIRFFNKSLRPA